jgi:hypothetical protein
MIKRLALALMTAATLLVVTSADGMDATTAASSITSSATAGGAVVTATIVTGASGEAVLHITIAPLDPGYHIYSLALPPNGVNGLGVPTRALVKGAFTAVGRPVADAPTQYLRIAALDVALPVYPDGPVTLTVRVTRRGSGLTDVIASYGLCSDARCMMPVDGLKISLNSD